MSSWFLLTVALVSALFGLSQSLCSPCPFQWMENGNYCYRYFPQNLSYDEAEMFCKQFSHTGHVAELATVSTLEELTFIVEYMDKVITSLPSTDIPRRVWLKNTTTEEVIDIIPILDRTLGPTKSHVSSCDSVPISGDGFQLGGNTSLIKIVPAPDVLDHASTVYAKTGSFLNIGDFKYTCISDPGLCESMTWSLWLKIDTSSGFTGIRYYITSGGQSSKSRGIAFYISSNMFKYLIHTSTRSYRKAYDKSKIPLNKWFHLALTIDIGNVTVDGALQLFVDGVLIASTSSSSSDISVSDSLTKLYLGTSNAAIRAIDYTRYGGSASYSHLTVFDSLLTQQQIHNLYSCGTRDWELQVRHLNMKSSLEYECMVSDPSGPVITWSLYHKQTDSWENLDTSGDDYSIQPVNVSTCVVRSTLVMSSSQVNPTAVACTAQAGSNSATALIYNGDGMFSLSDQLHGPTGISLLAEGSLVNYTLNGCQQDGVSGMDNSTSPFICEIPDKLH
ncbi:uncharacterized protein [Asterias amurensis]|uniref:uncharacterized protein n=1 Tax=Asterias amurensis TaxID=7602 RepID=UPI003AB6B04B